MPFKHNAARRHRIPKTRFRVQNWPAYEAGLKRRGDLTLWLDEAALAGWQAPRRTTPGGQARYSDAAIEVVLMLRLVFHLALRQAEGFIPARDETDPSRPCWAQSGSPRWRGSGPAVPARSGWVNVSPGWYQTSRAWRTASS